MMLRREETRYTHHRLMKSSRSFLGMIYAVNAIHHGQVIKATAIPEVILSK